MLFPVKVRGWHTVANKYFSPEQMARDQLTLMPDGSGFINVSGADTKLSHLITAMIPEYFIGRLDKNGKEIYEGDIVRAWCDHGPGGEGQHVFVVTFGVCGSNIQDWTFNHPEFLPEVIGNVHENLDFLEAK